MKGFEVDQNLSEADKRILAERYKFNSVLYDGCGLIAVVFDAVDLLAQNTIKDKWKPEHTLEEYGDRFFEAFKRKLTAKKWVEFFEENEIPELTENVKASIRDRLTRYEEWVNWLVYLYAILLHFWNEEKENSVQCAQVKEYYDFLFSEIENRGLIIPEFCGKDPFERVNKKQALIETIENEYQSKQKEREEIRCPRCGANNPNVHSPTRWICSKCGKTFKRK